MKRLIKIDYIRSRPRFLLKAKMSKEEFFHLFQKHFRVHQKTLGGYVNEEVSTIWLRKDKDKLWSPQLQVRVEESEDLQEIIEIRGLFGPRPNVWTLIMFCYGLGCAIILTVGLYGWVELALGIGNVWVWTNLLGLLLIVVPYVLSKIGQKISQAHISVLRTFMETFLIKEKLF